VAHRGPGPGNPPPAPPAQKGPNPELTLHNCGRQCHAGNDEGPIRCREGYGGPPSGGYVETNLAPALRPARSPNDAR
jgi:hypothetical protein